MLLVVYTGRHTAAHISPKAAHERQGAHNNYIGGDNLRDYEKFRAAVVAALSERKREDGRRWGYKDLAKATGYSVNTIEQFMCAIKITDNAALAIAKALDIPEHMAS